MQLFRTFTVFPWAVVDPVLFPLRKTTGAAGEQIQLVKLEPAKQSQPTVNTHMEKGFGGGGNVTDPI